MGWLSPRSSPGSSAVLGAALVLCPGLSACDPVDPCEEMCAAAAELYGACLADGGADWTAAGYRGADDFTDACRTWAIEQRQIERAAGRPVDGVDETCAERTRAWSPPYPGADTAGVDTAGDARAAACLDFTSTDWSRL